MKITPEQLKAMPREQREKLALAAQEKRERKKKQKKAYKPNEGQARVHASDKEERYVFSGNGAGKTAMLVNEALWAVEGYNPILDKFTKVPAKVIFVLDDPDKLDLKFIPEFKKWRHFEEWQFEKKGKPYISQINFHNGSFIKFLFHGMEAMKFESIELDFFAADEPPPYFIWSALTRGQRELGSEPRTLIVGTPIAAPWLRRDVYDPWSKGEMPDVECFRFDSDVNKGNINWEKQLKYFARLSEKEARIRRTGEFFDLGGLALAHLFKRDTHVIPKPRWPHGWPTMVVVDPHPSKKHHAVLMGVTPDDRVVVLKEMASKSAARVFATELKEFYKGYRVVDIISDSLGNSDSSGGEGRKSFISVLTEEGIRIRATTYEEKLDEAWIEMVQDFLLVPEEPNNFGECVPRLQVVEGCTGTVADFESVEWLKYKNVDEYKPKLDMHSKDYLSCVKYGLAARPRFSKGRERPIRGRTPASWNNREKWRNQA